jgi:hypothetical protein
MALKFDSNTIKNEKGKFLKMYFSVVFMSFVGDRVKDHKNENFISVNPKGE